MTFYEIRNVWCTMISARTTGLFLFRRRLFTQIYDTYYETDTNALYTWRKFNSSTVTEMVTYLVGSRPGHTWINAMFNVLRNFGHRGRFKGVAVQRKRNKPLSKERENQQDATNWHCSLPTTQRPTTATNHIQQNQQSTPYAVTRSLFSWRWA